MPFSAMRPRVGASAPAIKLKSVDLPAPFGPISAWRSPGRIVRSMPTSTGVAPNDLLTSAMRSAGGALAACTPPPTGSAATSNTGDGALSDTRAA
ncbi:Uncharacterised protein [Burkholderia pseudomallei]|nr:Uncharacterised protein [Burkholderia pseudomallei]CAJ7161493.1 Uncharacterised protein [Burkholderia pseudomallei]CAJ7867548.1 Uncharacterised protein [Burkholderia pseudomallei]CAJ8721693.1 Uncharacterised protein [Burkholderia pseudomallei]CAJ9792290.1 Uncharacterised protein [Burkholderia pseudomallei]